jgi:predicted metal-dependent enzyme (double-stranded beta helix superfamily)
MTETALEHFAARVRNSWGPLTSQLIADCSTYLDNLIQAPRNEKWLADMCLELPESRELYRDPVHGFVLLAHTETEGRYRPPHDHGRSWVIYGVLQGEMEMGTYARVDDQRDGPRLVKRGSTLVRHGEVQVYLPGDIHDTLCVSGPAIQFRFTARDLRQETTMVRYADADGHWVPTT